MQKEELRPFWRRFLNFDFKFGLVLLVLVCVARFFFVLKANQTGNYAPIGVIMMVSALLPFIFLSKYGRSKIGMKKTKEYGPLTLSFLLGISFSLILYFIGIQLFGDSNQNWYVYIGRSYNIPEIISAPDKRILFFVMAGTGMIFSPIGEELFFRGIVHSSFSEEIGEKKASMVDSSAFALVHISHFGLVFVNDQWDFYFLPTLLWLISMFVVSVLFFKMKKKSNSILGAIICHAGFNLGMIYCIFYLI